MGMPVYRNGTANAASATGLLITGPGRLERLIVSSSSSGTLKAWDALTATGTVLVETTGTLTAGQVIECGVGFKTGLFITISGTIAFTAVTAGPHE